MFAKKFENLIRRYPDKGQVLSCVANYFEQVEGRDGERYRQVVLDATRLFDISHAQNSVELAGIVHVLVSERLLKREFIVESPAGGGVAAFADLSEIPVEVFDPFRDVFMEVSMENVKTVYKPVA